MTVFKFSQLMECVGGVRNWRLGNGGRSSHIFRYDVVHYHRGYNR